MKKEPPNFKIIIYLQICKQVINKLIMIFQRIMILKIYKLLILKMIKNKNNKQKFIKKYKRKTNHLIINNRKHFY